MAELPITDGPKVKRAVIDGQTIDLYGAARAYRTLVVAVVMGIGLPVGTTLLAIAARGSLMPLTVFFSLQLVVGVACGWGLYSSAKARGRTPFISLSMGFIGALFGLVPILGLLPAASGCGVIHVLMNKLGLPVGWLGPSAADIAKLRHGVCHQCGYDLVMLTADRCPECNADIARQKPTADGFVDLVRIDAADAAVQRRRCRLTAMAGLVLGAAQWAIYLLLTINSGRSFVPVFVVPGVMFGLVTAVVALRAQQALREHGRADFVVAGFVGMCFPPLGSLLLREQAGKLSAAAARVQVKLADERPLLAEQARGTEGELTNHSNS